MKGVQPQIQWRNRSDKPTLKLSCVLAAIVMGLTSGLAPAQLPADPLAALYAARGTDNYGDLLPARARLRLGTVRLRHEWLWPMHHQSMVVTADGCTIISIGSADRMVRFWNVADGKLIKVYGPFDSDDCPLSLAISPDGKLLACGCRQCIRLWDMPNNREQIVKTSASGCLAFVPDSRLLLSAGDDLSPVIVVWDLAMLVEKRRMLWHKSRVSYLKCLPDNKTLVSADDDGLVHWANFVTGDEIAGMKRLWDGDALAVSPNGGLLAYTGFRIEGRQERRGVLRVIDGPKGAFFRELEAPEKGVRCVAFSQDSRILAAEAAGTISIWDMATATRLRQIKMPGRYCTCLAFFPDSKTLAVRSYDATIHLVNFRTVEELQIRDGHEGAANCLVFSADGKTLVSSSFEDQTVRVWDVASARQTHVLRRDDHVRGVWLFPDGKRLISGGGDEWLGIWDVASGREVDRLPLTDPEHPKQRWQVDALRLSPDGKRVLVSLSTWEMGIPCVVACWDVARKIPLFRYGYKPEMLGGVQPGIAGDANTMCMYRSFGLLLHDAADNRDLRTISEFGQSPNAPFVFSKDGNQLAFNQTRVIGQGKNQLVSFSVAVCDVRTGRHLWEIPNNASSHAVAFSPNGTLLAVTGQPGLFLVDLKTGKEIWRNSAPDMICRAVAFSPDGKQLAAGLSNSSIVIWDVARLTAH
jgi:WD40 repeat protein